MKTANAVEQTVDQKKIPRWGMVIDLKKCIGCDTCTVSCKAENRTPPGVTYNVVLQNEIGTYPGFALVNLPRPCMQCDSPPVSKFVRSKQPIN